MEMNDEIKSSDLTAIEKELAGGPGDLVDDQVVPARPRSSTVMFSLRVDRSTFEALSDLAEKRGRPFSEIAREALRSYVDRPIDDRSYRVLEAIAAKLGVEPALEVAGTESAGSAEQKTVKSWTDDELERALERYEHACRRSQMRENAWRSYLDYARRFLAWRKGDYAPRGSKTTGRPVPVRTATTADLRRQAKSYCRVIEAAGREQPTVDTYFRHAMFFVRWLEGDFHPGARLTGLK